MTPTFALEGALTLTLAAFGLQFVSILRAEKVGCRECPHCKALIATRLKAVEDEKKANAQRQHDADHRGWGYKEGSPDQFQCADGTCPRNKGLR